MNWIKIDAGSAGTARDAEAAFQHMKSRAKDFHLRHDLDWIKATHPQAEVVVYSDSDGEEAYAYALVFTKDRPLPFQIGELVWFRKKLVRHELWEGPVFADDDLTADENRQHTRDLLARLRPELTAEGALSIEGLPLESALYDLIMHDEAIKRQYVAIPVGKPFAHQFIRMPETVEDYFGGMNGKTRRNLKYDQRKLSREFKAVVPVCYQAPASVDDFLDHAIPLSKKTYQWRLLGLGLRDRAHLKETFDYAAQKGWLRNYILFVDGQAVAFMLGYLYEGCYYYTDVGFDPDWSKWSVGSVLQMHVIEDLYAQENTPSLFDFGTGYGYHKAQFGNTEREEINLLLLPRNFKNALTAALYRLNLRLEAALVFVLEKLGVKKALKKLLRSS